MRERCRWQMKRPTEGAAVEILRAYSEPKISGTAIGQVSPKATDKETPFTHRANFTRRRAHKVTPLRCSRSRAFACKIMHRGRIKGDSLRHDYVVPPPSEREAWVRPLPGGGSRRRRVGESAVRGIGVAIFLSAKVRLYLPSLERRWLPKLKLDFYLLYFR